MFVELVGSALIGFAPPIFVFNSTPTPAMEVCLGDADGDGRVHISELIRVIKNNIEGCRNE